jgi:hypothetical protein
MSNNTNAGGIGFCGALFLVFLVLKLTNVINWSWWWVTAPLWMPFAIMLPVVLITILVTIIIQVRK